LIKRGNGVVSDTVFEYNMQRRQPRWLPVLALALLGAAAATVAGAAASAQPATAQQSDSTTTTTTTSSSSSGATEQLPKAPYASSCAATARSADAAFVAAAAEALSGDSRLTVTDAQFKGACVSFGHAVLNGSTIATIGGSSHDNTTNTSSSSASTLVRHFERAVVLSTGAAELAASLKPGKSAASTTTLQGGDVTLGGFDAASLAFTVSVAPGAPAGLQLVFSFAFASEEGGRKRGGARPDAAAVFVGPAGAGAGVERNVALLPGGGAVNASAVLGGSAAEGLVVRDGEGADGLRLATGMGALTRVRGHGWACVQAPSDQSGRLT
jgi:hypothetical protein